MLHMKFGFDWPSAFRGEDVWKVWTTTTTTTARTDDRAWVYYKLTCEPSAQVSLRLRWAKKQILIHVFKTLVTCWIVKVYGKKNKCSNSGITHTENPLLPSLVGLTVFLLSKASSLAVSLDSTAFINLSSFLLHSDNWKYKPWSYFSLYLVTIPYEPVHEKTNNLHRRKQSS